MLEDIIRLHPNSTQKELTDLGMKHGIAKHKVPDLLLHGLEIRRFDCQPGKYGARRFTVRGTE
jgi:hypothetical protein